MDSKNVCILLIKVIMLYTVCLSICEAHPRRSLILAIIDPNLPPEDHHFHGKIILSKKAGVCVDKHNYGRYGPHLDQSYLLQKRLDENMREKYFIIKLQLNKKRHYLRNLPLEQQRSLNDNNDGSNYNIELDEDMPINLNRIIKANKLVSYRDNILDNQDKPLSMIPPPVKTSAGGGGLGKR